MATYKLIQDIEAEDHILGPLTLRQFIYGLVAAFCYYLSFIFITKQLWFLLPATVLPAFVCTFFAFPFGKDQSTEVWALAKIRFMFKPRKRVWDQTGIKELVTITAPKKVEISRTDGLNENEVRSRLEALANTLDSRGWVVKNVDVNTYVAPNPFMTQSSDRLVDVENLPQAVPDFDVRASDDIMDDGSNPVAQQFSQMITQTEAAHRQKLIAQMNSTEPVAAQSVTPGTADGAVAGQQPGDSSHYWFMNQPKATSIPTPVQAADQPAIQGQTDDYLTAEPEDYAPGAGNRVRDITRDPAKSQAAHAAKQRVTAKKNAGREAAGHKAAKGRQTAVTPPTDPAILNLANRNDLNVSTLAREAYKAKHGGEAPSDEVVISLR